MTRPFVTLSHVDMETVMSALAEETQGEYSWSVRGKELVYQILYGEMRMIRVYSSIDHRSFLSRPKNSDMIRVVYHTPETGWRRKTKIQRIVGWQERLRERVLEAAEEIRMDQAHVCEYCGSEALATTDPDLCAYHADMLPNGDVVRGYW